MKLLVLGGTVFLGRHLVEQALVAGVEVTLFTRGKHNPDLFPEAEHLVGDRTEDLSLLRGRRWDAVVDTSGYLPSVVRRSASLLAGSVERYVFISSISVYQDFRMAGLDEDYPLAGLPPGTEEKVTDETYGALKALCEVVVSEEFPERALNIRPGLIVGPFDPSDRFTYWPERIARGGDVLAPPDPERVTQVIDARDLASWILRLLRAGTTGVMNATSPPLRPGREGAAGSPPEAAGGWPLTFSRLFDTCRTVSGSDARFTWVSEEFLLAEQVGPWMELPLWVPNDPDMAAFDAVSVDRAQAAGLTFRPIDDTVRDTLDWARSLPPDRPRRAGLDAAKEAELLRKWKERG